MSYPELISVDGIDYEINTGYEYALACFRCINDPDIAETERALGIIGILYKQIPDNLEEAMEMAIQYLRCGKEEREGDSKADMDFDYDENFIKASFMTDYKIDLDDSIDMHWWKFSNLLNGLTDTSILNRVRDLRNYDASSVKDPASRRKIAKAQRELALPNALSQEDQDLLDEFYSQLDLGGDEE